MVAPFAVAIFNRCHIDVVHSTGGYQTAQRTCPATQRIVSRSRLRRARRCPNGSNEAGRVPRVTTLTAWHGNVHCLDDAQRRGAPSPDRFR
jgi:hypothetical protein